MQPGDTITPGGSPEPAVHLEPEVVVSLNPAAQSTTVELPKAEEILTAQHGPTPATDQLDVALLTTPQQSNTDTEPTTNLGQHPAVLSSAQQSPYSTDSSATAQPDTIASAAQGQTYAPTSTPPPTWQFSAESNTPGQQSNQPDVSGSEVAWSASEYVAHHKNTAWFVGLGLVVATVTIVVYLLSHDYFSPLMIALLGIGFGVFASRQPRVLDYKVNAHGISIGVKFYAYESFKTFSITRDGFVNSVVLAPLQRFSPTLTAYYDPQDEDKIIDVLGSYLPFEEAKPDAVDSLMRRVRF